MKRISLSFVSVLASIAALAGAGPSGVASAEELYGAGGPSSAASAQLDEPATSSASVVFHVANGISLGAPTETVNEGTRTFDQLLNVGGKGAGYRMTLARERINRGNLDVKVTWPLMRGRDFATTGYTVTARIRDVKNKPSSSLVLATCTVQGPEGKDKDRFRCSMNRQGYVWHWDAQITDSHVNRLAEASGSISTADSVSLGDGQFVTESNMRVDGAEAIPARSSTQFDAVLKATDKSSEPATARMRFRYAIHLPERPPYVPNLPGYTANGSTQLYVRGSVSNYRGGIFSGNSSCDIVTADDQVVQNTGYECTMKGAYLDTGFGDGRGHYRTDFEVSKKK